MSNIIKVNDWKGVFSNGDIAQIDPSFCAELENLRPVNGKLVKTLGIGAKIATAAAVTADNLYTYIHDELTGDELYILVYVNNASDNIVTIYGFYSSGPTWQALNSFSNISMSGTFYHDDARNPIVFSDGILRFLPGALGESPGTNECKTVWLGYIDREYFDGNYDPTAQFYGMAAEIVAPSIDIYYALYGADEDMGRVLPPSNTLYYRFTYIYDGVQESLFSDPLAVRFPSDEENSLVQFFFTITKANHNKRVTSMNIYRSELSDGAYGLINSVDFTRESGNVEEDTDGGVLGEDFAYVSNLTHTINLAYSYRLYIGSIGVYYEVTPVEVNGKYIFQLGSLSGSFTGTFFNGKWWLYEDDGGGFDEVESDDTGLFVGDNLAIVSEDLGTFAHYQGVLYFDDDGGTRKKFIQNSYKRAVWYLGDTMVVTSYSGSYEPWKVLKPSNGLYLVENSAPTVLYNVFDTGQESGVSHPLQNKDRDEEYIKVNGKFGRIVNSRLFQLNVVLDPGGKNEAHDDWLMYSEFGQYDVNPVSNQLDFPDTRGGEGTGLAEVFGNPVVLKNHAVIFINSKTYPADPVKWNVIESKHEIGNIAPDGYIEAAGDLYVCYYDGIYRLSPNNLAETDSTPTEKLRVSEPIGDTYNNLSLADKVAIQSAFNPETGEVIFYLGSEYWCFNIFTEAWREITSAVTPAIISHDENGQAIVFQNSDKKLYSFAEDESVAAKVVSKTFEISPDTMHTVRHIVVTYKAKNALTMKVYYEDEIPSGNIARDVVYTVREKPYIDGATFEVTYVGSAKNHEDTFTGLVGKRDYTTSGTGVVELYSSHTLPANGAAGEYWTRIGRWCRRLRIEITDAAGTDDAEIHSIEIKHD